MAKDGIDFGELSEMHIEACNGGRPTEHRVWVDWTDTQHASDNKYLIANAIEVIEGRSLDECDDFAVFLSRRPLHEDETNTGSGSYRKTIDGSTLDMGAAMHASRRETAATRLLARVRASMANLLLGVGNGLPRRVVNHGTPGTPLVLIGDGPRVPLAGDPQGLTPFIAIAGMRSTVRARTDSIIAGSHFNGDFEYTLAEEQRVMLAQVLGHPYNAKRYAYEHAVYTWAESRGTSHWGLYLSEIENAKAFVANPLDADLAYAFAHIATESPLGLPIQYDRYADGSIFVVMLELRDSSTGGRAISGQYGRTGNIVHASADNGGRAKDDIKPQRAWETEDAYCCQHLDGGPILRVSKPQSERVWSARFTPGAGLTFLRGDDTVPVDPTPTPPSPPPGSSQHAVKTRMLTLAECASLGVEAGSWLISSNSEDAVIRPTWAGGNPPGTEPTERKRWVVEP